MNKILMGLLVFVAVFFLFLGAVFVIAGDEFVLTGGVLILLAFGVFALIYLDSRIQARKPTLVSQTFNVKMEGSGEFKERDLRCKGCGAPLGEKDVKVIEGGLMVTCPYCGRSEALEERPKW